MKLLNQSIAPTALVLFLLLLKPGLTQNVIVLQQGSQGYLGCSDAHILINKPSHNTGAVQGLELTGNGGVNDAKHGLIRFDLSSLPQSLEVDSAWVSLYLHFRRTEQREPKTLGIYELLRDWGEGTGIAGEGYDGRPAGTGECNWHYARYSSLPWTLPGANGTGSDTAPQALDSVVIEPGLASGSWVSFDVTETVRRWIADSNSNQGWLVREPVVSPATGILNFASANNASIEQRPKLTLASNAGDALFVGALEASAGAETLAVRLPVSGDCNDNAVVQVAIARTGQPQFGTPVAMERSGDAYRLVFYGLMPATYFVRVTASDADGIYGSAVQTSSALAVSANWTRAGALRVERLSGGRLRAVFPFFYDANGNNTASIRHRPRGEDDWSDPAAMVRKSDRFEAILTNIASGDIQAQIADPDGVQGDAEQIRAVVGSPDSGAVRLLHADARSCTLTTGVFTLFYHADSTDGWIHVQPDYASNRALCSQVLTGWNERLLQAKNIDSLSVHIDSDSIRVLFHTRTVFTASVTVYAKFPGLIRWRCTAQPAAGVQLSGGGAELALIDLADGRQLPSPSEIYARSAPNANSLFYLHDDRVIEGSLFYFANLTALNDYFASQQTAPRNCAVIEPTTMGFYRPSSGRPLAGQSLVVLDSFTQLTPG
ncbi:DNRLRE domain-containing protein, partial [candidate division KSB1 bacterium]|nr:DNRLRE domain-containing protein [candidate division KSB1 bacterium]